MAGTFTTQMKKDALDGTDLGYVSLHSGDPGTTGASLVGSKVDVRTSPVFSAASGTTPVLRALSADVPFTGLTANQAVSYFGIWDTDDNSIFVCGGALTGDATANAAGEYTLKGTTTYVSIS